MIPLDGCRVRVRDGKHINQQGYVVMVIDARDKLSSLRPDEASQMEKRMRAQHGSTWMESWYEANVTLSNGVDDVFEGRALEILEPELIRPENFHPLRT